ncbi:MAG: glycosyltransferase family 2 protein [Myxococcales bacterium]|nr:glycosyltransferase family 2 protein [Myxococcales bacterium]
MRAHVSAASTAAPSSVRSLSVVLPCWNEVHAVGEVIEGLLEVRRGAPYPMEVVIVDDGSTDGSAALLHRLASRCDAVRVVRHGDNRGYGAALRTGFAAARGGHVLYMDADGQLDPRDLPRVVALLDRYDAVSAYRAPRRDGPLRRAYGLGWTSLTNALLRHEVRDINCAFKVFPRWFVAEAELRSTGALLGAELLSKARRRGLRVGQVGVRHRPRVSGRSTGADPNVIGRAFGELIALMREPRALRQAGVAVRSRSR